MIFEIKNTVISGDILQERFVCDLNACKGCCCVEGDAGAPLENKELNILDTVYDAVKPYLSKEGVAAIERQGRYILGDDNEWETPLIDGKACAYLTFDVSGIAQCGIEQAYSTGAIDWKKPISCHLYPIRIKIYEKFTGVNYHRWEICGGACKLGQKLRVPVYKFLKEPLIRKFGKGWYDELETVAECWYKHRLNSPK